MKNAKIDTNHVVEAVELLNKVEGGINATGQRIDSSAFTQCDFFVCGVALYGSVIDPHRFDMLP